MRDITHKIDSRRDATALARVHMPAAFRDMVRNRQLAKGDALEIARVAAVQAIKKTWDLIPYCHQIPITAAAVHYEFADHGIDIRVTATTVAPTGVEMEAMVGAAMAALTIYDMLKPHTPDVTVGTVALLSKTGGKSDDAWSEGAFPVGVTAAEQAPRAARWLGELAQPVVRSAPLTGLNRSALLAWLAELGQPRLAVVLGAKLGAEGPEFDGAWPGVAQQIRGHAARRLPSAAGWTVAAGQLGDSAVVFLPDLGAATDEALAAAVPALLQLLRAIGSTAPLAPSDPGGHA